jgi:signal transduction histidine kinase
VGLWLTGAGDRAGEDHSFDWSRLARGAAALHLLAVLLIGLAWQGRLAVDAEGGGLPALHLLVLVATGAAAALLALRPAGRPASTAASAAPGGAAAVDTSPRLLAQMSHELRTPLNAMIGFSEVMLQELHGPLGHARYQEYAAYISASGGRLLEASEATLAVTATMSALMADRSALRREHVRALPLLREAWTAAVAASGPGREARLALPDRGDHGIACDRRVTAQALEQLLREAMAVAPPHAAVEASVDCRGDAGTVEIVLRPAVASEEAAAATPAPADGGCGQGDSFIADGGLRVVLARSLLEMQGATLRVSAGQAGPWWASIAFPAAPPRRDMRQRAGAIARRCRPSRREDCARVAAARASAGSPAAPPA